MSFCINCGTKITASFCPNCGTPAQPVAEPIVEPIVEPVIEEIAEPVAEPVIEEIAPAEPVIEEAPAAPQVMLRPAEEPVQPVVEAPAAPAEEPKKPVTVGGWIVRSLIPAIPVFGWIAYLVFLFVWMSNKKREASFRNWAKAQLLVLLIVLAIGLLVGLGFLVVALLTGSAVAQSVTPNTYNDMYYEAYAAIRMFF